MNRIKGIRALRVRYRPRPTTSYNDFAYFVIVPYCTIEIRVTRATEIMCEPHLFYIACLWSHRDIYIHTYNIIYASSTYVSLFCFSAFALPSTTAYLGVVSSWFGGESERFCTVSSATDIGAKNVRPRQTTPYRKFVFFIVFVRRVSPFSYFRTTRIVYHRVAQNRACIKSVWSNLL